MRKSAGELEEKDSDLKSAFEMLLMRVTRGARRGRGHLETLVFCIRMVSDSHCLDVF